MQHVEVIAHRGASAERPEHTLAAYDLALAQGADMLELDGRATADGELVVVHDPTLLRTTGCAHRVDARTLADIRASCGADAPLLLDEVLERYGGRTRLLVELKDPDPAWEASAAAAIARHGRQDEAIIQSFDAKALRRLRLAHPWLSCVQLLRRRRGPRALDGIARYATGISVWQGQVDARLVRDAHDRGLAVRAWTVNSAAAMDSLRAIGVDGVITDLPAVATSVSRPPPALAA